MTITVSGIVFGLLLLLPPIYILYVFGEKLKDEFRKQIYQNGYCTADHPGYKKYRSHYLRHALVFFCAYALRHACAARSGERTGYDTHEHAQLAEYTVERAVSVAAAVYPCCQHRLGHGYGSHLDRHWNSKLYERYQLFFVYLETAEFEVETETFPVAVEVCQRHNETDALTYDRGERRAESRPVEHSDKKNVQDSVQDRRYRNEIQRPSAVAHAP